MNIPDLRYGQIVRIELVEVNAVVLGITSLNKIVIYSVYNNGNASMTGPLSHKFITYFPNHITGEFERMLRKNGYIKGEGTVVRDKIIPTALAEKFFNRIQTDCYEKSYQSEPINLI